MRVKALLARLKKVSRSGQGWKALCPGHDDKVPSLAIALGDEGRLLLKCHAGCAMEEILGALGLRPADLFAEGASRHPDLPPILSASHCPPVATWLRDVRGMPDDEIARMHAIETNGRPALALVYADTSGRPRYVKLRSLSDKRFWCRPSGATPSLYGLETLAGAERRRVIVTEGELDAHALRAVGLAPVISVPNGASGRPTETLLAPLADVTEILIATDADEQGENLADRLASALGRERCRRLRFSGPGGDHKDANAALIAGWTASDFEAAIAAASPCAGGQPGKVMETTTRGYEVRGGETFRVDIDRQGNERLDLLANFAAAVEEDISFDDGVSRTRMLRVSGTLGDRKLPEARISAAEFEGLSWVMREWGVRATVSPGSGRREHLRAAIQAFSRAAGTRTVYAHTGWRQHGGEWIYLYQGGAVGAPDIEVQLEEPCDRYVLPERTADAAAAIALSETLLDCGPTEVTAPLLGAVYAAPLASIIKPDFAVWLVGISGSLKSELCALAVRHFGAFSRKSLPGSWSSTSNALELLLSVTKDMLTVIDDFAPQGDSQAQREQTRRAEVLLRNVGNQTGRSRLRADLSQRPVRTPRGLVVCSGEDHPPTPSIVARLVLVDVDRRTLNFPAITRLQTEGDRLPHAMRAYVEWLRPQYPHLVQSIPARLQQLMAEDFSAPKIGSHLRAPSGLATLYLGLETFYRFAVESGALAADVPSRRLGEAKQALLGIGRRQAEVQKESNPAGRFIEALRTLLLQGRAWLRGRGAEDVVVAHGAATELVGWSDSELAYLMHDATRRVVLPFLRESGDPLELSAPRLLDALVKSGLVLPSPDGSALTQLRFGGTRYRVLRVPLAVLFPGRAGGRHAENGVTSRQPCDAFGSGNDAESNENSGAEGGRHACHADLPGEAAARESAWRGSGLAAAGEEVRS